MKLIFFIFLILHLAHISNSFGSLESKQTDHSTCELSSNETLIIGCTHDCGRFNIWAIKWYARFFDYNVKVIDLWSEKENLHFSEVDGIIIPGGADIDPKYYIDAVKPDFKTYLQNIQHHTIYSDIGKVRDEFEFKLLDEYFKNAKSKHQPILGICRGMQALTVSQGIPLYGDLKNELDIENRNYTLDLISITKSHSLISQLIGRKEFRGVELHHQGLHMDYFTKHRETWPHLAVTALSHNGQIAEVLEFNDRPILGVQFHPEYTFGKTRKNIFKWLLTKACLHKISKKNLTKDYDK